MARAELTSKSIEQHIRLCRQQGRLVLFDPERRPNESYRRRLWLHPVLSVWVNARGETQEEQQFFADVRALLKKFVIGEDFDDDVLLKELKGGKLLWSVRITFHPQDRIIGGFLRKGEFVGTNHRARNVLANEGFIPTLKRAREIWDSVFPSFPRNAGNRTDLLSDFEL